MISVLSLKSVIEEWASFSLFSAPPPAIREMTVRLYHDNFPKRLNEPLQVSELYDKTIMKRKDIQKMIMVH